MPASDSLRFIKANIFTIGFWIAGTVVLCAVGWGTLLASLQRESTALEHRVLDEAATLSKIYATNLSRTLGALDQVLLHVRYEHLLIKDGPHLGEAVGAGSFPQSPAFTVGIVDANGMLLGSTRYGSVTQETANRPWLGNRPYFLAQKNSAVDALYIGSPDMGVLSGKTLIRLSRKLQKPSGGFDGVVFLSIAPEYFTASYDMTRLGKYGILGFAGSDKTSHLVRIGDNIHTSPTKIFRPPAGFGSAPGSMLLSGDQGFSDLRNRYIGWQGVPDYPLIAFVGLDQQDALLPYFMSSATAIRTGGAATVAVLAVMFAGIAFSTRLAQKKHELEITRLAYRMATESGRESFYIVRPIRNSTGTIVDFETVDCNLPGAALFNLRREELIGKRISSILPKTTLKRLRKRLVHAFEAGHYEGEMRIPAVGFPRKRWIALRVVRAASDLALTVRDVSEAKTHAKELERSSNVDAVTGLGNRHWFQTYLPELIQQAASNNAMFALLFIDLDGFKAINDATGHATGDELLGAIARRLAQVTGQSGRVVRLGADEFVVILQNIGSRQDAAHAAERLLRAFKESFRLRQGMYSLSASIGISLYPSDGLDESTLLRNADIAMYSVKSTGKANYRFFDPVYFERARARLQTENELRHAIENDQFVMYYQPRTDISTGLLRSMEALVRWEHPSKGLVSPEEFIPIANETGLISKLGELVIDKVCAQVSMWTRTYHSLIPVSINVAPLQFEETDVAEIFLLAFSRHHIDPDLIEVEITESSIMADRPDVQSTLNRLHEMNIKLAIDDFGTGYSSLSQLQALNFDLLKIDKSFTSRIHNTDAGKVFVSAIITMAHALNMRVVAEGVETKSQLEILRSLECDEAQGYYISRPVPSACVPAMFQDAALQAL